MVVYKSFDNIDFDKNTVATVGTFDGLHLGHQSIVTSLRKSAEERNARSVIITFDPHPQVVVHKEGRKPIRLLTSIKERLFILEARGVDAVVVIPFTREFSETTADEFIRTYIAGKLGLTHLLVGHDHLFGKDRKGNQELLENLSSELDFTIERLDPLLINDEAVSSTKIRNALTEGEVMKANAMLGYPYIISGIVVQGDGRGRKLGIPTANVRPESSHKLFPKNGVYLVSSIINGQNVFGMANIGLRPTFTDDTEPTLEVHFFNWNEMLYGRELMVSILKYIRPEQKFESIDMFFSQLSDDMMTCQEVIEKITHGEQW